MVQRVLVTTDLPSWDLQLRSDPPSYALGATTNYCYYYLLLLTRTVFQPLSLYSASNICGSRLFLSTMRCPSGICAPRAANLSAVSFPLTPVCDLVTCSIRDLSSPLHRVRRSRYSMRLSVSSPVLRLRSFFSVLGLSVLLAQRILAFSLPCPAQLARVQCTTTYSPPPHSLLGRSALISSSVALRTWHKAHAHVLSPLSSRRPSADSAPPRVSAPRVAPHWNSPSLSCTRERKSLRIWLSRFCFSS